MNNHDDLRIRPLEVLVGALFLIIFCLWVAR